MKKTKEYIKRQILDEIVLVPTGETAQEFNGMITLSDTGNFIWDHIETTTSFNHLIEMILEEYDIDKETATQDAASFIMQMLKAGMIRPSNDNW